MGKFVQLLSLVLIFPFMHPARNVENQSLAVASVQKSESSNVALLAASEKGDAARVEQLLASGVEVNTRNEADQTPLMLASHQGHL